ncbi:hypothetical protein ACFYQ5_07100 [Streptomyces sp. NPDC005794]|uniref:hypothetical protein n=1 Tax=Streptomyces sp. NPDC005794 TaxID=3364733 RepID=UPI00367735FD
MKTPIARYPAAYAARVAEGKLLVAVGHVRVAREQASAPSVSARLLVLGGAIAAQAVIAQLMHGGVGINIHAPVDQLQGGAQIMYYCGDIAESLLGVALVATWCPQPAGRRSAGRGRGPRCRKPLIPFAAVDEWQLYELLRGR